MFRKAVPTGPQAIAPTCSPSSGDGSNALDDVHLVNRQGDSLPGDLDQKLVWVTTL
jgi:hypothetical protein